MNTREKILDESLTLFSEKGFDAISVRDIARAVGIKESSLYNHFKSKQDIFDNIVSEYSRKGSQFFQQINLIDKEFAVDERTVNMYKNMTPDQFEALGIQIFEYYFCNEITVKFRKMLTMEQYRNKEISKLFREHSFDASLDYQAQLFAVLIREGCFIDADPYLLALAFVAPIFLIFYKFDNDEKGIAEARELFVRHIRQFNQVYGKTNE